MRGEDAIEAAVRKRERERIALDVDGRGAWRRASASIASLWSRPTTSPRRWRVRKPVPQATSSVRPPGNAPRAWTRRPSSSSQPGPVTLGEETRSEVPVVVFGRAPVVVLLHGPRVRSVLPLESVPNFSEGRDQATIDAIGAALAGSARLLDVHADADHNRSVFTVVGRGGRARRGARRGGRGRARADRPAPSRGRASADRRGRRGPDRAGRAGGHGAGAGGGARGSASGSGSSGCRSSCTRRPSAGRRSIGAAASRSCSAASTRASSSPDFGPARLDPSAGGVIVGARRPLIAFNVNLRGSLEAAQEIAALVREHEDGGFPGVRALGLELPRARARAGVDERRGLGGRRAARDRRARRSGGGCARGGDGRAPSSSGLMPAAPRSPRRARRCGSTASTPRACSSCACSESRSRRSRCTSVTDTSQFRR